MRTVICTVDLTKDNTLAALLKAVNKCHESARLASEGTHGGASAIHVEETYRGNPIREVSMIEEVLSDKSRVYNLAVTF